MKAGVFEYTGRIQEYVVPTDGIYRITAIGSQGGGSKKGDNSTNKGGKGGKSISYVELNAGQTLYIAVGGRGTNASIYSDVLGG